ncbi:MAG: hypothetical protein ACTTKL_05390 [Treponema sp.]
MKKSSNFYKTFFIIFAVVVWGIVAYAAVRLIDIIRNLPEQDRTWYLLVIMAGYILYFIFVFLSFRLLLKYGSQFSKIDILENWVNSDKDKELIKKYCDTLVEL